MTPFHAGLASVEQDVRDSLESLEPSLVQLTDIDATMHTATVLVVFDEVTWPAYTAAMAAYTSSVRKHIDVCSLGVEVTDAASYENLQRSSELAHA